MRISDWSSDVCSSYLARLFAGQAGWMADISTSHAKAAKEPLDIDEVFRRLRRAVAGLPKAAMFELRDRGHGRSEERRVGKECVSTFRSRVSPYHYKKNTERTSRAIDYIVIVYRKDTHRNQT